MKESHIMNMTKSCFNCGMKGTDMYSYTICEPCKTRLGLFTDETIKKHVSYFNSSKKHSYEDEVHHRLIVLDKAYIKKRIKLLHIQERLKHV